MPVVFTQRIIEHQFTSAVSELIYVVPGGTQVVLRELCLSNTSGGVQSCQLWLNVPGNPSAFVFLGDLPSGSTTIQERRIGMNPADQLYGILSGGAGQLLVTAY